jgi:hypothetical protein
VAESAGGPCPARNLGGLLRERLPRAQVLVAEESPLGPDHFDWPGDGDVAQSLWPAGMHPGADHTARRAAGLGGGFDTDPALPEGEDLSIGDSVAGRLKMAVAASGRGEVSSIKTSHGSKLSSRVECFFLRCGPCGVFVVAGMVA